MSDHEPLRDLLPGYALGILNPREERRVRRHVERCPECGEELARLTEVSADLSLTVTAADPPPALETRIMNRIEASLSARRFPRRTRAAAPLFSRPALGAAAAVFIVVLAAGNILQWMRVVPSRPPAGAVGLVSATLTGSDAARDAYGTIVLDPEDNHGVLAVRGLPRLDAAHQYQLWILRDGQRRSAGVFSVNDDGYGSLMLDVPKDFKGFRSMGITVEPFGGSTAPTGARVMSGAL
jgi:anti-sigma-K factor RskA